MESFYERSKVKPDYCFNNIEKNSANNLFLQKENIITEYDSTNHVRIMKYFSPPPFDCGDDVINKAWENDCQNSFYIRCYLPKRKIANKNTSGRITDVIIMYNGLNEYKSYGFYDTLGSFFANEGISTILLPTPYHLNRRIIKKVASGKSKSYKPSEYVSTSGHHLMYLFNFQKSIYELSFLIESLTHNKEEDNCFYSSYYDSQKLRITLFGFSLGATRALAAMMTLGQKKDSRIVNCICFNPAIALESGNIKGFDINHEQIRESLEVVKEHLYNTSQEKAGNDETYILKKLFQWLYFPSNQKLFDGELYSNFAHLLRTLSPFCLFIQSASDRAVSLDLIQKVVPDGNIHRVIVPEADHLPIQDIKWGDWLTKISNYILSFIRDEPVFSRQEIVSAIAAIITVTKWYEKRARELTEEDVIKKSFTHIDLQELIGELESIYQNKSYEVRNKFMELYYISKAYFPKFPALIFEIKTMKIHERKHKK